MRAACALCARAAMQPLRQPGAKPIPRRAPRAPPRLSGPLWEEKWRHVLIGRELRREVGGEEQVGVVMHRVSAAHQFV